MEVNQLIKATDELNKTNMKLVAANNKLIEAGG